MILLDTHAIVWWAESSKRLSTRAAKAILSAQVVLVSPLSIYELALLSRKGRVGFDIDIGTWAGRLFDHELVIEAPPTHKTAVTAASLGDRFPGDPIDRLLYATAAEQGVPFVSRDERIRAHARIEGDVRVIW